MGTGAVFFQIRRCIILHHALTKPAWGMGAVTGLNPSQSRYHDDLGQPCIKENYPSDSNLPGNWCVRLRNLKRGTPARSQLRTLALSRFA